MHRTVRISPDILNIIFIDQLRHWQSVLTYLKAPVDVYKLFLLLFMSKSSLYTYTSLFYVHANYFTESNVSCIVYLASIPLNPPIHVTCSHTANPCKCLLNLLNFFFSYWQLFRNIYSASAFLNVTLRQV